jgi:hypothetical protein
VKRLETVVGWVAGFLGTVFFFSFSAMWVLHPAPHGLAQFNVVMLGILMVTILIGAAVAWAREHTEAPEESGGGETPVEVARNERPAHVFGVWWAGLSLMVWGGSQAWRPLGTVVPRDLIGDPLVVARVVASLAIGWVAAKLLFAAADRGWIH